MTICILGRQAELSLAELCAKFGPQNVQQLNAQAAIVKTPAAQVAATPLGGTIKIAQIITEMPADWAKISAQLPEIVQHIATEIPEGKIHLGLSVYGLKVRSNDVQRTALQLKKAVRELKRSVRVVPNKKAALNSAQVLHNQLTGEHGIEIVVITQKNRAIIARTVHEQDIDDYTARDFERPKRSGFVGMLPPKLAQIMLNLADVQPGQTVLDPFCGTGVVLQEAALMDCDVYGTDLSEQMVRYTRDNLAWLTDQRKLTFAKFFEEADATTTTWRPTFQAVVCETYLGPPLSRLPDSQELAKIRAESDELITSFLKNLAKQIPSGTRCCIAVPAWRTNKGFLRLPVVDRLSDLGYNRSSFLRADDQKLIYHRADQIVARDLLVITRK